MTGWKLSELRASTGPKVLSCFHGGGGSSMGYKLAGYDVIGGVDVDSKMAEAYRLNLRPRWSQRSDIRTAPVPAESVDILDGSPPCTPFSTAGLREKGWGTERRYLEGACAQRLDDLFFAFIAYADKIRPKIIVAENVTGLVKAKARGYVKEIFAELRRVGYRSQLFQLSAARHGVPQYRDRVFFVCRRDDLGGDELRLPASTADLVTIGDATRDVATVGRPLTGRTRAQWQSVALGRAFDVAGGRYGTVKLNPRDATPTLSARSWFVHWNEPAQVHRDVLVRAQSFPDDYDFRDVSPLYACGMSVPPFLTRFLAQQIGRQWLDFEQRS